MKKEEIKIGQIFKVVTDNFFATKSTGRRITYRPVRYHVAKGECIEIRYAFEWNYRTEDDLYVHSDPQYILDNCKLIGSVKPDIRSANKANLEEILRLDLFDKK